MHKFVNFTKLKKKLLYQSTHRGCKELDIILGDFATRYLTQFNSEQLKIYEKLLHISDNDIYNWIIGVKVVPAKYNTQVLKKIIAYGKEKYGL